MRLPVRLSTFRPTVRLRLTLWYVVILALVLAVFSGVIYYTERARLESDLENRLNTRIQQVADAYNERTGRLDVGEAGPTQRVTRTGEMSPVGGGEIALLITPEGTPLQLLPSGSIDQTDVNALVATAMSASRSGTSQKAARPGAFTQALTISYANGFTRRAVPILTSRPIIVQNQVAAILIMGMESDVGWQMDGIVRILLIVSPIILLLSAGGGYWLARRALKPVQAITRAARHIGETDLTKRLNLKQSDELGELAGEFDNMLNRLEAAFARQRQFTADASHEMRTPLTITGLEAERALAQPRSADEYRQAITIMQQENANMSRLVSDLLTLARADAGRGGLRREVVDLSEVVLDSVERLAPLAHETGVAVVIDQLPACDVQGDSMYLGQMITNVIENALKHGAGSATNVSIGLERQSNDGHAWARLMVSDDGPGIAAEHLPRIFDRFYRVDQSRTHGQTKDPSQADSTNGITGSGLGLAITQWIAQAHGGGVSVRSQPEAGTVFEIRLPLANSLAEPQQAGL